ncbi:hypothetical protein AX16_003425 [Volvariella volvacea WC 439]|nr:hypothetical protein AX16_003425 [Volvariella volvacea WC 439]
MSLKKQNPSVVPSQSPTTKKRKREESPESTRVTIDLSSQTPQVGPILGESMRMPQWLRQADICERDDDKDGIALVVGETDTVEFTSDAAETERVAEGGCRYLVAVHNRRSGALTIFPQALTPYIMTHTVKALKSIPPSEAPTAPQYREARTTLGETFGTKKAKAAIRAQERNKVDVTAMKGVVDFVMDGIEKGAEGLMTQEEAKAIADENRLIPPFVESATDPADVYPLHSIIPEVEWRAISTTAYDQASSDNERKALLPHSYSRWCNNHLSAIYQGDKKKKEL